MIEQLRKSRNPTIHDKQFDEIWNCEDTYEHYLEDVGPSWRPACTLTPLEFYNYSLYRDKTRGSILNTNYKYIMEGYL